MRALCPMIDLQVSKRSFVRAMAERGSVILVPGGQAELLYTGRLTHNKEFVIYPRHKGALWPSLICQTEPACVFDKRQNIRQDSTACAPGNLPPCLHDCTCRTVF